MPVSKRHTGQPRRIYASGGEGAISVFEQQDPDHYKELARVSIEKGARTSFYSPEFDRLFLAVRHQGSQSAAVRDFIPSQGAGTCSAVQPLVRRPQSNSRCTAVRSPT